MDAGTREQAAQKLPGTGQAGIPIEPLSGALAGLTVTEKAGAHS